MITSDIIAINKEICSTYGNVFGIREPNLLASIIDGSEQDVFGEVLYKTKEDKVSYIVGSIIKNHVFIDGNKRTGVVVLRYFYPSYHNNKTLLKKIQQIANMKFDVKRIKNILF